MSKHDEAVSAFQQGQREYALRLLEELLQEQESSELWNDWAIVQVASGNVVKAEGGLRRALQLDPQNHPAKADLGILLLSQGDHARGIKLIEECIPQLPAEQQEMLRTAVEGAKGNAARVLFVHDGMPDAGKPTDFLLQIVQDLQAAGHALTFLSREAAGKVTNPLPAGIEIHAGDSKRLAELGIAADVRGWALEEVLQRGRFDLAILTQNFGRGISVPEHYLDAIRHHSPQTRIAILEEGQHGAAATARAKASMQFRHHELAENWSRREEEAFQRADLAIISSAARAGELRAQQIPVALVPQTAEARDALAQAVALARSISPKPLRRDGFSMTLVDTIYASLLEKTSGEERVYARLDAHIQLAEQLLRHGKAQVAREQLRHIFGWLGESVKLTPALAQPLGLLKRCYRELGEIEMAERCGEEARRCFAELNPAKTEAHAVKRKKGQPLISLIVPTYNRLPILKKCLAALEAQTVAKNQFEVIVIDDGSTDGTEAFMREYKAPFRLHSLRQKNSGTGMARRHGVEHASGEYLLLMNDDTICSPNVIQEHLATQNRYPGQKWAVLGNFQYPEESRRRAMTHFFCVNSFMFPQVDMEEGCPYGYAHFITCNLSIRREAVLQVGSFDGTYMLSEDTEMGIKLFEQGYCVLYHPAAHAWHDHAQYAVPNLIRRARIYGADYFHMFRNHPRVMKEWAMPIKLTGMDPENGLRIRAYVEEHRQEVQAAVDALSRWDTVDFEPVLANRESTLHVLSLFQQSVPAVHWFHLFERMLEVMAQEFNMPELAHPSAMAAAR